MAVAPIVIILIYIFVRDKYEKEPIRLLVVGVVFGIVATVPIIIVENKIIYHMPIMSSTSEKFYLSFVVASLVEELFKFIVVYALVFGNRNYNERYDGIVYAVFVSLGFALVENVLFVTNQELGGLVTGIMRGVVSVPAHALYGLYMGYYMSMAKYINKKYVILSFGVPYILHGIFDTILSFDFSFNFGIIIVYIIILCIDSSKKIKYYISLSPFKNV